MANATCVTANAPRVAPRRPNRTPSSPARRMGDTQVEQEARADVVFFSAAWGDDSPAMRANAAKVVFTSSVRFVLALAPTLGRAGHRPSGTNIPCTPLRSHIQSKTTHTMQKSVIMRHKGRASQLNCCMRWRLCPPHQRRTARAHRREQPTFVVVVQMLPKARIAWGARTSDLCRPGEYMFLSDWHNHSWMQAPARMGRSGRAKTKTKGEACLHRAKTATSAEGG